MSLDFSPLAGLTAALMYKDRLTVERYASRVDKDGVTRGAYAPHLQNVPCRISKGWLDPAGTQTPAPNRQTYRITFFCAPGVDLRKGDRVTACQRQRGRTVKTYAGVIGDPRVYDTHQQAELLHTDDA